MPRTTTAVDTAHRHMALLQLVPRAPRSIDTGRLAELLEESGHTVHRRSIQRDLEALTRRFPGLDCNCDSKPFQWSWRLDAPTLELPGMDLSSAVTLELLQAHMKEALPRSTLHSLQSYFARARDVLRDHAGKSMARWPRKIRVQPRGLPRIAAAVSPAVLEVVYGALLRERRLRVVYRARGATKDSEYVVNGLGLVLRHGAIVLVCTFWEYDNAVQLVMHRIRSAEALDEPARVPKGFDLDAFVESGQLGYRLDAKPVRIRVRFHRDACLSLHETPISKDQQIRAQGEEHEVLHATVPDTTELRAWLRGYGALAEVLAPAKLRRELAGDAKRLAAMYS